MTMRMRSVADRLRNHGHAVDHDELIRRERESRKDAVEELELFSVEVLEERDGEERRQDLIPQREVCGA
jgi:hypothetical protein